MTEIDNSNKKTYIYYILTKRNLVFFKWILIILYIISSDSKISISLIIRDLMQLHLFKLKKKSMEIKIILFLQNLALFHDELKPFEIIKMDDFSENDA